MFRSLKTLAVLPALLVGGWTSSVPLHAQGSAPLVTVHRQPAIPLVSLRMSLLVDDPPGMAGAGHLLQHLHYQRLLTRALDVGGQVRMERTSDAIVYTITGPAAELDFLAELLRSTLTVPAAGTGARLAAERVLQQERLAEWETAGDHLRAALRARLFPGDLSAAGTPISAARLSDTTLEEMWERMYRPDRVVIVAVGDVDLADVRGAFAELPSPPPPGPVSTAADTAMLAPLAPAEATRGWLGAAFRADDLDPAALSVAARLMAAELTGELPGAEVTAEHWWTHHGQALAIAVALQPRQVEAAQRSLAAAFGKLADEVDDAVVEDAAAAIRHDMLFYSRTPDRMAEVIGRFIDRGGEADAAHRFYAELEALDANDLRVAFEQLAEAPSVVAEIPPQTLNTGP